MRVLFMGTPEFAAASLRALHEAGYEIAAVVTQPDRPRGRGLHEEPSPVGALAQSLGLPVLKPPKVNDPAVVAQIRDLAPDVIVVVAFGQILRPALLEIPRLGCVNVHASLLPRHRGGSPIQHTLLAGDRVTGVTTMLMDPGMDTGPMLLREEIPVAPDDTAGTLFEKLAEVGARLLLRTLPALAAGEVQPEPQDASQATYAPNLKRDDARVDWTRPAEVIRNQARAFSPRPGAWFLCHGREVKLWRADVAPCPTQEPAGRVLAVSREGILVATGEGCLLLREVQEAGKARMPADAFARGARVEAGSSVA